MRSGACCNGVMVNTQQSSQSSQSTQSGRSGQASGGGPSAHYGPPYTNGRVRQSDRFFQWIRESGVVRLQDRWIGGVCSGMARTLGWSPTLVRALMAASVVFFGFGAALYAFAWLLLPDVEDGRIIGEDLLAGRWDWVFLGPILCMVVALAVPGVGLPAVALAGLTLFILLNVTVHRARMSAMPGQSWQPGQSRQPGQPGRPGQSDQFDGTGQSAQSGESGQSNQYGQQNPVVGSPTERASAASASAAAHAHDQSQPTQPMAVPPGESYPTGQPAGASTGYAWYNQSTNARPAPDYPKQPAADSYYSYRPATGGVRAMTVKRRYARRRPAGFAVVSLTLGVILLSAAWFIFGFSSLGANLESLLKTALMWSAAASLLFGLVIIMLGLAGRRSGGLIPLALISVMVTIAVTSVSGGYAYVYDDMNRVNASYTKVVVSGSQDFGSSEQEMHEYAQGVAFTGSGIDNGQALIDLSGYAEGRHPHDVKLEDGSVTQSSCPVGTLTMTVHDAKVLIRLPRGCSFAYSDNHGSYSSRGVPGIGGRFAAIENVTGWIGVNVFSRSPTLKERTYAVHGDHQYAEDPELLIHASHVLQGQVNVEYSDPVTGQAQ